MSPIKLFSGTTQSSLSQEVAEKMGITLSKAEIVRFDDSECRVMIQEDVKDQDCVIIQSTCNPTDQNLMELILFCDALKRSEARKVIGVLPLFGYARQNAQHRPGECVSMHVVAKMLETVGFDEVYTFDLHEEASSGIFSIPFQNIFAFPVLAPAVKSFLTSTNSENVVIVTPDQEGIERARKFGEEYFGTSPFETATVSKKRDLDALHTSAAQALFGEVKGKTCILVDDICTSGGTLINAATLCLEQGAKRVLAVITHGDFSTGTAQKLQNSPFEAIFVTNTIPLKKADSFSKLREVSIATLIADKLQVK